jgi:hypothetical protein
VSRHPEYEPLRPSERGGSAILRRGVLARRIGARKEKRTKDVTTLRVQRILCDNPDCVVYVDELVREEPDQFALVEHVRSLTVEVGWTHVERGDFCPAHGVIE